MWSMRNRRWPPISSRSSVQGERNGRVEVYQPLDDAKVSELQKVTSEAVRDRCSPKPSFDFVRRSHAGGWLLAVNVSRYAGQPVGVSVTCKKDHDGYGGRAFVFPVHVGVDTWYLAPEQLPARIAGAEVQRLAAAKSILAKFIFFPLASRKDEALRYTQWCRARGIRTSG